MYFLSSTTKGLDINKRKCIVAEEETGKTSKEGVYAVGDAVTGAATVVLAMGAAKAGAEGIIYRALHDISIHAPRGGSDQ